jgi:hypothetical protein
LAVLSAGSLADLYASGGFIRLERACQPVVGLIYPPPFLPTGCVVGWRDVLGKGDGLKQMIIHEQRPKPFIPHFLERLSAVLLADLPAVFIAVWLFISRFGTNAHFIFPHFFQFWTIKENCRHDYLLWIYECIISSFPDLHWMSENLDVFVIFIPIDLMPNNIVIKNA